MPEWERGRFWGREREDNGNVFTGKHPLMRGSLGAGEEEIWDFYSKNPPRQGKSFGRTSRIFSVAKIP